MRTFIALCVAAITATFLYRSFRTTNTLHLRHEVEAVRLEGKDVVIEHSDGAWRLPASQVNKVKPGDVVDLKMKENATQGWYRDSIVVTPKENR